MTWKLQQIIWEIPNVTRLQAHKQLKDSVTDWSKQQWTKQSETKQNTGQTHKVTIHSLLYFLTGPFNNMPSINCNIIHGLQNSSSFLAFISFLTSSEMLPSTFLTNYFSFLRLNLLCEVVFDYCHLSPDKEVHLSL